MIALIWLSGLFWLDWVSPIVGPCSIPAAISCQHDHSWRRRSSFHRYSLFQSKF
jgi:hypothetical protein